MVPLPKRKYAKSRQGKRRSHLGVVLPSMSACPQCHSLKVSHHVCPTCGSYDGREVLEVKAPKKPATG